MEYAASFTAPQRPEMGPRYPDWILLAKRAYISDRKNETVAHSHTSDGHPIQVSLFAASPPAVSHLCVDCPVCLCPGREDQYIYNPVVVFSRDDLILLNVYFAGRDMANYFIYRADPKAPSLVRTADPEPYISVSGIYNTGIVCCGGAGGHFAVAALAQDYMTDMFKLSVFKSETGAWETRLLPLEPSESLRNPSALRIFCSKVIPLKGSILGWVDIWRGILLCDVLSDNPELRYIPMPKPMPGNEGVEEDGEPTYFRDVAGCGDLIRFVEMGYEEGDTEPADPDAFIPDEWTMVTRSWKL